MKAVVLAAGKGTRLNPITANVPKPMLTVGSRPVVDWTLAMVAHCGVREVFLNLHHCAEALMEFCGDGRRWGVRITYAFEPKLLGTAGAVRSLAPQLGGESPVLVVYGDNFYECDISGLAAFHKNHGGIATLALFKKEDVAGAGIVQIDGSGRVARFVEKPSASQMFSDLVNGGVYILSPEVLCHIPAAVPCDFGHDAFPSLLAAGHAIYGCVMEGAVWPIDTPPLYRTLRERMGDGPI